MESMDLQEDKPLLSCSVIRRPDELPSNMDPDALAENLHQWMKPYEDTLEDIRRGIDNSLSNHPAPGGFLVICRISGRVAGILVMISTGMKGYAPESMLLFVGVDPLCRNQGIGRKLIERALKESAGSVKLHVEYDNPAKRLYDRLGFTTKYAEMRLSK